MKSKFIISCKMMHNLIKRVMSYFTDLLRGTNRWMDGLVRHYVHTYGWCNTVYFLSHAIQAPMRVKVTS